VTRKSAFTAEGQHPADPVPGERPVRGANDSYPAAKSRAVNYSAWPRLDGDEASDRHPAAGRSAADHPWETDARLSRMYCRGGHCAAVGAYVMCCSEREWCSRVCCEQGVADAGRCDVHCLSDPCQVTDAECLAQLLEVMEAAGYRTPAAWSRIQAFLADPVAARLVGRMVRSAPEASAELYRYVSDRLDNPVSAIYDSRVVEGLARLEERLADGP